MDAVFYFTFYEHSINGIRFSRSLAFYITNISTTWDELDTTIQYCGEDMDWSNGEHSRLIPTHRINAIGYVSSEIEGVELQDQLMQQWQTIFLQKFPGCLVGDVLDVTSAHDDEEIFERTKDAHEQRQAEQLRKTLADHVVDDGSVTQSKKM